MATRYVRFRTNLVISPYSDYSRSPPIMTENTYSPNEKLDIEVDDDTSVTTVTTTHITTADYLYVEHLSTSTANISVAFSTAAGAQTHVLGPGEFLCTPDFDPSANLTITAASGTETARVVVWGT